MGSRFIENGEGLRVLRLEDMQCIDCRFRTGEVSGCEVYEVKPHAVLCNTAPCPDFQPAAEPQG